MSCLCSLCGKASVALFVMPKKESDGRVKTEMQRTNQIFGEVYSKIIHIKDCDANKTLYTQIYALFTTKPPIKSTHNKTYPNITQRNNATT